MHMITAKFSSYLLPATLLLALTLVHVYAQADTTTIGLLNPILLPQQQGWLLTSSGPEFEDIKTNGTYITSNTSNVDVSGTDAATQSFYRWLPVRIEDGYTVDFWLKVQEVQIPHAPLASGIGFYAATSDYRLHGGAQPANQLIYFDQDGIGWGDDAGNFPLDTTNGFHHYRVEVTSDGAARVLVDDELALQRSDFQILPYIALGDTSNLADVNGRFSVSNITVTGLITTQVPVDIRPSNCPNTALSRRSTKNVPVTIAGTADLDVTHIDTATIRINGLAPAGWSIRDATKPNLPYVGKTALTQCTKGRDKRNDLVLAYNERALVAALHPIYDGGPYSVRVSGKFKPEFGGDAFVGEDVITIYSEK